VKSATPRRSSSARIWWLTAVAVMASSSAACLKLRWRAEGRQLAPLLAIFRMNIFHLMAKKSSL
jgi:hypothetical protein